MTILVFLLISTEAFLLHSCGVVYGGELLPQKSTVFSFAFEEEMDSGSFSLYKNGGQGSLTKENNFLRISVEDEGETSYALQLACNGFPLYKNCIYTLQFDLVSSDRDREITYLFRETEGERAIYHQDTVSIKNGAAHYEADWVMTAESDPLPVFLMNLGKNGREETGNGKNVFLLTGLALKVKDSSCVESASFLPEYPALVLNQVGYRLGDNKTLVLKNGEKQTSYIIVNQQTGQVVFEGQFTSSSLDEASGTFVQAGDFSALNREGRYYAKVVTEEKDIDSFPFEISQNIYDGLKESLLKVLYHQRCGMVLDAGYAKHFAHPSCHTEEAVIYETGEKKDVSGGWHDAGDYGRYTVAGVKAVMDLLLAYESGNFDRDDTGIPESGNGIPDILDEARYELEWLLKMQDPETGGVFHQVTPLRYGTLSGPLEEQVLLYISPVRNAATAGFSAVLAKASRVFYRYDEAFSGIMLESACTAWKYLQDNYLPEILKDEEEIVNESTAEGIEIGAYKDAEVRDEVFWAAVELYLSGKALSLKKLINLYPEELPLGLGWSGVLGYALWDFVASGRTDLFEKEEAFYETCKERFIEDAEEIYAACDGNAYAMGFGSNYYWGSNMRAANNGIHMAMAGVLSGKQEFFIMAKRQADYLLGQNPLGYCFVTGEGTLSPRNPHHGPSHAAGMALPGMLVGGPCSQLRDAYAASVLSKAYPAMCYIDHEKSYSTNEFAIYYNSAFICLLSMI